MKKGFIITSVLTLISGGVIYLLFRSKTLYLFDWFDFLFFFDLEALRDSIGTYREKLPDWFLFSLPDGLWMCSYSCLMIFIWQDHKAKYYWIFGVYFLTFAVEVCQLFGAVAGTFDILDIIFYSLGVGLPLICYKLYKPFLK